MEKQHPLRVAREAHNLTREQLAEKIGLGSATIKRAEYGDPLSPDSRQKLCIYFGMTSHELGLCRESSRSESKVFKVLSESDDMVNSKRRELFHLLGIAGVALMFPSTIDWERVEGALIKPSKLDEQGIRDLATINRSFWNLYKVTPQKKVLLDGVLGQLKSLISLLEQSHSPSRQHLCTLASDLAQLAGEIFFDGDDYDIARSCYSFAADAAKEARHRDLWACALVRSAFLPIYEKEYQTALPLLLAAQKLANHGDSTLVTRFWVSAVQADTYAGLSDLSSCQKALDLSQGVGGRQNGSNGGWLRFDNSRLLEQQGACYVKLGQPGLAIPSLQKALLQDLTPRRQGMVLTDYAFALLQTGDIDGACLQAGKAIDITAMQGSGMLRKGLDALRIQLTRYVKTSAVKRFNQQLLLIH